MDDDDNVASSSVLAFYLGIQQCTLCILHIPDSMRDEDDEEVVN